MSVDGTSLSYGEHTGSIVLTALGKSLTETGIFTRVAPTLAAFVTGDDIAALDADGKFYENGVVTATYPADVAQIRWRRNFCTILMQDGSIYSGYKVVDSWGRRPWPPQPGQGPVAPGHFVAYHQSGTAFITDGRITVQDRVMLDDTGNLYSPNGNGGWSSNTHLNGTSVELARGNYVDSHGIHNGYIVGMSNGTLYAPPNLSTIISVTNGAVPATPIVGFNWGNGVAIEKSGQVWHVVNGAWIKGALLAGPVAECVDGHILMESGDLYNTADLAFIRNIRN